MDEEKYIVGDIGPLTADHAIVACAFCGIAVRVSLESFCRGAVPVHEGCLRER